MSSVASRMRNSAVDGRDDGSAKAEVVNFKMVTFSLADKDYGIDIMKVKEIARFVNFTYVPNTPPFVRGVYNLRGEIISIIDFRALFNLSFQQKANTEEEAGLILRLDNNLIGVVVDKIDKVVGINLASIQPPHPIFGDINIKYISGVVENDGRLYIILDVDRVLGKPEDKTDSSTGKDLILPKHDLTVPDASSMAGLPIESKVASGDDTQYRNFVKEALQALTGFTVSDVNREWFDSRYAEWSKSKTDQQLQIRTKEEANEFLDTFCSPFSAQLWGAEYFNTILSALPDQLGPMIQVWNPGCGRGYESYALMVALRTKYPDSQIKIWASDKDLLNISGAPNLVFSEREVSDFYTPYMTNGKNGLSFSQKIKEGILFEYHDISNNHALPPMDLIFTRDVVSYMGLDKQTSLLHEITESLKKGGYLMLGKNESPPLSNNWEIKQVSYMKVGRKV